MKNPWMSLWLSAANTWTGAARGSMAAGAKRSRTAILTEMTRQAAAFWMPQPTPVPVKVASRKRRTGR